MRNEAMSVDLLIHTDNVLELGLDPDRPKKNEKEGRSLAPGKVNRPREQKARIIAHGICVRT